MSNTVNSISKSLTSSLWKEVVVDPLSVQLLSNHLSISSHLAHCLVARDINTVEKAQTFLNPSLSDIPNPEGILNLPEGIRIVTQALTSRQKIRIVGDYDCDGTTGLITLLNVFRRTSPDADKYISFYVPDREREGYGLNTNIIETAAKDGISILISVDIGITAYKEWALAKELGLIGICLDHHTVLGSSAPTDAIVICPKQAGCNYTEKDLAACGLSLQFGQVLLKDFPNGNRMIESLTKLVAIGTVADLVPLSSLSNRAIVAHGLKGLSSGSNNIGLSALLEISGLNNKALSTIDLGYRLAPRINAAGRIDGSTLSVVDLFDSKTVDESRRKVTQIDNWNKERQDIQHNLVSIIVNEIEQQDIDDIVYVLAGEHKEGWHQGVVGIAASKIVEQYHRPALVCSIRGDMAHGSARSISQFNIIDALQNIDNNLFHRFGGHAAAAGFALSVSKIPELRKAINNYARQFLTKENLIRVRYYDLELSVSDITILLIKSLEKLGPHGIGNPVPRVIINGKITDCKALKDQHIKLVLSDGKKQIEAIWWQQIKLINQLKTGTIVQALGRLEINEWNGVERAQMIIEDIRLL